jgi:hypothetical protein
MRRLEMKIAYVGTLPMVHVSGVGKCKRGASVEAPADIAKKLLKRDDWTDAKKNNFKSRLVEKKSQKSGGKK